MIKSNHFLRILDLSLADLDFHSGQAWLAASIAFFVSSLPHLGTVPIFSKVAGLLTVIVSPDLELTHSPLTKHLSLNSLKLFIFLIYQTFQFSSVLIYLVVWEEKKDSLPQLIDQNQLLILSSYLSLPRLKR